MWPPLLTAAARLAEALVVINVQLARSARGSAPLQSVAKLTAIVQTVAAHRVAKQRSRLCRLGARCLQPKARLTPLSLSMRNKHYLAKLSEGAKKIWGLLLYLIFSLLVPGSSYSLSILISFLLYSVPTSAGFTPLLVECSLYSVLGWLTLPVAERGQIPQL